MFHVDSILSLARNFHEQFIFKFLQYSFYETDYFIKMLLDYKIVFLQFLSNTF